MNGPHAFRLDLGSRDENRYVAQFLHDQFDYVREHDAYFIKGHYAEAKKCYEAEMMTIYMAS